MTRETFRPPISKNLIILYSTIRTNDFENIAKNRVEIITKLELFAYKKKKKEKEKRKERSVSLEIVEFPLR